MWNHDFGFENWRKSNVSSDGMGILKVKEGVMQLLMRMEEKAVYINVLRILGNFGSQSEHLDF